jgi:hypothetical protein
MTPLPNAKVPMFAVFQDCMKCVHAPPRLASAQACSLSARVHLRAISFLP